MFIVSAVFRNFVLDLEACQKRRRPPPPLAECKGMYKLNSLIMALGKIKGTELTFKNLAFVHTVVSLRP